jgi:hypothetical protein
MVRVLGGEASAHFRLAFLTVEYEDKEMESVQAFLWMGSQMSQQPG